MLSEQEQQRWAKINAEYCRRQSMGEGDIGSQVVNQISRVASQLEGLQSASSLSTAMLSLHGELANIGELIAKKETQVQVINQPSAETNELLGVLAGTIENSLLPVVSAMEHTLRLDHDSWDRIKNIGKQLKDIKAKLDIPRGEQ